MKNQLPAWLPLNKNETKGSWSLKNEVANVLQHSFIKGEFLSLMVNISSTLYFTNK